MSERSAQKAESSQRFRDRFESSPYPNINSRGSPGRFIEDRLGAPKYSSTPHNANRPPMLIPVGSSPVRQWDMSSIFPSSGGSGPGLMGPPPPPLRPILTPPIFPPSRNQSARRDSRVSRSPPPAMSLGQFRLKVPENQQPLPRNNIHGSNLRSDPPHVGRGVHKHQHKNQALPRQMPSARSRLGLVPGRRDASREASSSSSSLSFYQSVLKDESGGSNSSSTDSGFVDEFLETEDSSSESELNPIVEIKPHYQERLSKQLLKFYNRNSQNAECLSMKRSLCDRVYTSCRQLPELQYTCNVFLVGSTMNGCASKTSDADLCLYLSETRIDKRTILNILTKLCKRFRVQGDFRGVTLIRAVVPILKFNDRVTGFECDLNINNSVGIRNTHLLKAYSLIDERIVTLMFGVKYWARYCGVNDASQGTFNSYSLALMTIFFLQVGVTPPVAPVLQQCESELFSQNNSVENLPQLHHLANKYKSSNTMTVGELFFRFIQFYNSTFRFNEDIASIRLGKIVKRSSRAEDQWTLKHICVEEPFDCSNTARAVFNAEKFARIHSSFTDTYRRLKREQEMNCFST